MSTSKHIDALCALITALTVLLTVLFMNGAALGLEPVTDGDGGTGQFTDNDLDGAWDASGATHIDLTAGTVTGSGAYVVDGDVHIVYGGRYVLTGTLTDGSVIVETDGDRKVWLLLDGADVRCEDSAALLVEQAEKVFLTLADGTENTVSSGPAYGQDAVSAGIDGAVYSRDDLTINGSGSLTVAGEYQHGIVCNDDLVIAGGTVTVTAAQDGLHANDSTRIANADLTITAGDDGVTVSNDENTGYFYMASGRLAIPACREGVEAINVTFAGGTVDIAPTDDGVNASGGNGTPVITVTGGDIRIVNAQGMDADGLDSNGNIYIEGGRVFISMNGAGGSCAVDYGSEYGGVCQVNGGTLIACGGSAMVESLDTASAQGFVETAASGGAGAALTLTDGGGNTLISETVPSAFSYVMLSAPGMTTGSAYGLAVDGTETQVTASDVTAAQGMGGMFGAFSGRGGGRMQNWQPAMTQPTQDGASAEPPAMQDGQAAPQFQQPSQDASQAPSGEPGGQFPAGLASSEPAAADFGRAGGASGEPAEQLPDAFAGGMIRGGRQFTEQLPQDEAAQAAQPAASPEALILLAASVLALLAGILIAAKYKH